MLTVQGIVRKYIVVQQITAEKQGHQSGAGIQQQAAAQTISWQRFQQRVASDQSALEAHRNQVAIAEITVQASAGHLQEEQQRTVLVQNLVATEHEAAQVVIASGQA